MVIDLLSRISAKIKGKKTDHEKNMFGERKTILIFNFKIFNYFNNKKSFLLKK